MVFRTKIVRSDVAPVAAAAIIGESVTAITLAQVFLTKFGGDSLREIRDNFKRYRTMLIPTDYINPNASVESIVIPARLWPESRKIDGSAAVEFRDPSQRHAGMTAPKNSVVVDGTLVPTELFRLMGCPAIANGGATAWPMERGLLGKGLCIFKKPSF